MAALGLTPLECDVYRFLLAEPGCTGYRAAQALGKPVGNIYKAIEGLEEKGAAATSDDDGNRTALATPPEEWLRARRSAFESACTAASEALADIEVEEPADEACYRLISREQVVERWNAMLERCTQFAIATIAPALVGELAPALQRAAARVPVAVKVFAPVAIAKVEVVVDPRGLAAVESGPGSWVVLSADGRESLVVLLDPEGRTVNLASWTRHPMWAWSHYTGMSSDLLLCAVRTLVARGAGAARIAQELARLRPFECETSAGKSAMRRRYRGSARRGGA